MLGKRMSAMMGFVAILAGMWELSVIVTEL